MIILADVIFDDESARTVTRLATVSAVFLTAAVIGTGYYIIRKLKW
jgi:hypothetical protein